MIAEHQSISSEARKLSDEETIDSDKEQPLDDMMVEINDHDGNKGRDKEMKARKENKLVRAGKQVRDMAMKRKIERDGEGGMGGNGSSDRECKSRKRVKTFAMDDELLVMIKEARSRQKVERERARINERQIEKKEEWQKRINARKKKNYL